MKKRIELEVEIQSEKSRAALLKTVSKLVGIDQVTFNKEKGILSVVGDVDPVDLTKHIRKAKKRAQIIRVGPPTKPLSSPCREAAAAAIVLGRGHPPPPPPYPITCVDPYYYDNTRCTIL